MFHRTRMAVALAAALAAAPLARAQDPTSGGGGPRPQRAQLLPDIGAIGSASLTWDDRSGKPVFAFEELELALQSVVDPYVRADVFIAFGPEEVDVEEAFVTTLGLPAGLQLRAGKIFAPFGRLNQTHPHAREFVTTPLAQGLLAEESLGGGALEVGWLAPLPWYAELKVSGASTAPAEGDEPRLTGIARLAQYFSLGESTTLGLGLSAARRDEAPGAFRDLAGADLYLRFRPPESRSYLTLSGELVARRFTGVEGADGEFETGGWAQAFGRLGRHFGLGARWEQSRVDATESEPGGDVKRITGLAAWLPSEFQRIRLEVSSERRPGDLDVLTAILHLEFGIGAHGAHPF